MARGGLEARIEKLEQDRERRTVPAIIWAIAESGETLRHARARTLEGLGLQDRPGLNIVSMTRELFEVDNCAL